mgnify:CR=1
RIMSSLPNDDIGFSSSAKRRYHPPENNELKLNFYRTPLRKRDISLSSGGLSPLCALVYPEKMETPYDPTRR